MEDGIAPPLSVAQFRELVSLLGDERVREWETGGWASLDDDGRPIIDIDCLATAEAFEQAVRAEQDARAACEADTSIWQLPEYDTLKEMPGHDRRELAAGVKHLVQSIERIKQRPLPWAGTATKQILGGAERTWRRLREDTLAAVQSMTESAEWLDANLISPEPLSDLSDLLADASGLRDHLKAGGGWGFWPFRGKVVKRALHVRDLRIGGRRCETLEAVSDLVRWLDAELKLRRLRERWKLHHEFATTTFTDQVAELENLGDLLKDAFEALAVSQRLSWVLAFEPGSPQARLV